MGVFALPQSALLEVRGPDAVSFLHAQLTQDILGIEIGCGAPAAQLDRLGHLRGMCGAYRLGSSFWLLCHAGGAPRLKACLEGYHVGEDFEILERNAQFALLAVQGPHARGLLETGGSLSLPEELDRRVFQGKLHGCEVAIFAESLTGESGVVVAVGRGQEEGLLRRLLEAGQELGAFEVGPQAQRSLRLEAGLLHFGAELSDSQLLPGTGYEATHVSYRKGCYTGQEVVARIRTYGQAPRVLMAALLEDAPADTAGDAPVPGPLEISGQAAGEILAVFVSPVLGRTALQLWLKKDFAAEGLCAARAGGRPLQLKLLRPPLYRRAERAQEARQLYAAALDLFSGAPLASEQALPQDEQALDLLRRALALDPGFSDAYEVLGVLLGRHGRYDEAIEWLKQLARVDPGCLMAYSNLSVFYMKKGLVPEAEKYRDKATAVGFQRAAAVKRAQRGEGEEKALRREDAARRKALFAEVLEVDGGDVPALFGLGRSCLDLDDPAAAAVPLGMAVKLDPGYSAAWLLLGRALEESGQRAAAAQTYTQGIAAAEAKGDLMPLKEMRERHARLAGGEKPGS